MRPKAESNKSRSRFAGMRVDGTAGRLSNTKSFSGVRRDVLFGCIEFTPLIFPAAIMAARNIPHAAAQNKCKMARADYASFSPVDEDSLLGAVPVGGRGASRPRLAEHLPEGVAHPFQRELQLDACPSVLAQPPL